MQIHELTQCQHVDEGILDKVKGGIAGAKAGYQDAGVARQAADLSKRGYDLWSKYARQLTAQYGQDANFKDMYKQQLLAFVQKNLLGGAYLPNLTNKDQILKSVDELVAVRFPAGNTPPPADTNNAPATTNANAPQDAAATVPAKIETGKEVALGNVHYRWLGAQWALVNPKTGQTGKTAEKGIAPELTKMAQAGKFVTPYTSPDAGALSTDQMAANAAAGKKASPTGFDTATGKPLPKPTTTGAGVRMGKTEPAPGGAATTAPATPTDEPIFLGGKKLDPKNPNDAKVLATMKAQGKLNEYADLDRKLREAVYKAKANNPNAADQTPYVQGRAGDGANPGQFAKFDPATSTTANAAAGVNAMAAGGQAAKAATTAPTPKDNSAQEKQLFQKLVKDSLLATATVATGQAAGSKTSGGAATATNKQVQDPQQMVPDVQQVEKVKANVDEPTLAAVGAVLRQNYQLDPSIRSTGDDAVDALLLAMGFKI